MRLYMLAILLVFTVMATSPSMAAAADDNSNKFSAGSRPAKETSANKYVPPANNNRPGGGGHGRPNYGFDKPGRPGDHHSGRPGGSRPGKDRPRDDEPRGADAIDHQKLFYGAMPTNSLMYGVIPNPNAATKSKSKPKRRPNRNYGWGYSCYPYCDGTGLGYDNYDDDDQGSTRYVQPREPERSFESGGTFEWFDDPRNQPAHDSGYPKYSGGQQSPAQPDIDQYHMMMKAWQ